MMQRTTQRMVRAAIVLTTIAVVGALCPVRAQQEHLHTVAAADPQVKDDLFAGTEKFAQGATNVTEVNLDPNMLGMVAGGQSGELAHKMKFVVVRSYRYPKPGMYKIEDVEPYRQKLRTGNWNCFVHVSNSNTGESADVCTEPSPNHDGSEMVVLTVQPMELTFVHMSGDASLADLQKLSSLGKLGKNGPAPAGTPPAAPR
jgi:hypothetical protein